MNSETLSPKLSAALKWLAPLFACVSFIGFLDAAYLTANYYWGVPINCSIFNGCEQVLTSRYASVAGVPVSLFGAFYYLAVLILTLVFIDGRHSRIFLLAARLTVIGLAVSLGLLYLQIFVLEALCLYCLVSAATSISLFALGCHALLLNRFSK